MEWVSEFEALHFNTLHDHHYSTALTKLHDHYSTALYSLHCTTTALHCTILTTLHHHYSTALYSLHSMAKTPLRCMH